MTESVELRPDAEDDRVPHRVAITVFATVNAVDQVDAEHIVRQTLLQEFFASSRRVDAPRGRFPTLRHSPRNRDVHWDVTIASVTPLYRLFPGSYLRIQPTDHAFPNEKRDEDDL